MSLKPKTRRDILNSLEEVIQAAESISNQVHEVSEDPEVQRRIDTEVKKIADQMIKISDLLKP